MADSYLLTDAAGFPLMVSAFEGNKAETKTMLPVIEEFLAAHQLPDVTVVADAGMISEANQQQIEAKLTSTAATPQATETLMLAGSRVVPGDFHGQSAML